MKKILKNPNTNELPNRERKKNQRKTKEEPPEEEEKKSKRQVSESKFSVVPVQHQNLRAKLFSSIISVNFLTFVYFLIFSNFHILYFLIVTYSLLLSL